MADAIYILMLHLTPKVIKMLSEHEKAEVEQLIVYITLIYIPSFLKSTLIAQAPSIDLKNIKLWHLVSKNLLMVLLCL